MLDGFKLNVLALYQYSQWVVVKKVESLKIVKTK